MRRGWNCLLVFLHLTQGAACAHVHESHQGAHLHCGFAWPFAPATKEICHDDHGHPHPHPHPHPEECPPADHRPPADHDADALYLADALAVTVSSITIQNGADQAVKLANVSPSLLSSFVPPLLVPQALPPPWLGRYHCPIGLQTSVLLI
jgi:hypothetical protein